MRTIPVHPAATRDPAPQKPPRRHTAPRPAAAAILDDPVTAGVLHAAWSGDPAVVVPSPPGSGKTRLVALLASTLAERAGLRVGVAAQTRDQAAELARRIGQLGTTARLLWPRAHATPTLPANATVVRGAAARFPRSGGGVIVATTARWLFNDPGSTGCDLLIVDEAWQATYGDVCALGSFAPQVVCVGDPGQIAPVVTGRTSRWATSPTGPHQPAPAALIAAHGEAVSVVGLPHTWRLGPATTALIQPAFYPDLPFTSCRPPEHLSLNGQEQPELSTRPVSSTAGPTDPALITACTDTVRDLLSATLTTTSGTRPLAPADLAVVVSHVTQAAAARALLADLPDVLVGTANQLQGMERAAAVVLHPLAGHRTAEPFSTDFGRACVMLSRHRAHLAVITDTASRVALAGPSDDPGVATHRTLLDRLT